MSSFEWSKCDTSDLSGPHYSVFELKGNGMAALRALFPEGRANALQQVLFSTSGVHGTYTTIEDVETQGDPEESAKTVTFLIIQPRLVCMRYGVARPIGREDFDFLKSLRASSIEELTRIGQPS